MTEVQATLTVTEARTGATFAGPPSTLVERAVNDEVEALRSIGGVARAAAVSAKVRCDVRVMSRPAAQRKTLADAGVDSGHSGAGAR